MSIVVVTPNPAVDVTYRVAQQRIGVTQRVQEVRRMPGGKGLNVARVLAALGAAPVSVLPLGGAAGSWIAARLDELRLPARVVAIAGETRSTVSVVDDGSHPTVFSEPGPALAASEWERLDDAICEELSGAAVLVVSGSLPAGTDPEIVAGWVSAAHERGVRSIVDASGAALLAAARAGASLLKPNREELLAATGADDESAGARQLLALGARAVIASRGPDGIAAHLPERVLTLPAAVVVRGNPTGAGDAAAAGLALALARDLDIGEALRLAGALGAAAVLRPVAGEIDVAAYERALAELPVPREESSH